MKRRPRGPRRGAEQSTAAAGDFIVPRRDFIVPRRDFIVPRRDFIVPRGDFIVPRGEELRSPPREDRA